MVKKVFVLMSILGVWSFTNCKKDKASELVTIAPLTACDSVNTDFTTIILPIMTNNCSVSGCHNAATNAGGVTLDTYTQISAKADRVLGTMQQAVGFSPMPKFQAKLPDSTVQKIDCWIDKGMPQ